MQGLSAKGLVRGAGFWPEPGRFGLKPGGIGLVTQDRMADMREVDADLVCTAGFKRTGQQARDGLSVRRDETLAQLPVGYCGSTALPHGAFVAGVRMAF